MKLDWGEILEVLEAVEADQYDEVSEAKTEEERRMFCLNMYLCWDAGFIEPFIYERVDPKTGRRVVEDPVPRLTWKGYQTLFELRGEVSEFEREA